MTKATRTSGAIAAACLVAVAACGSDGDEATSQSASTAAPATAVEGASDEPTTTEPPETTPRIAAPTTEPPTITEPATVIGEEYLGIVWESAVDPQRVNTIEGRPELVDGPMSMRVDMFLSTPGPDESPFCAAAVEDATGPDGKPLDLPEVTSCLIVEWQIDVSEEAADNSGMDAREAVTADGLQVPTLIHPSFSSAPPGGTDSGSAVYPNLGPGSQIRFGYIADLPEGKQIVGSWEVVVPDTFQPIDWFEDQS
jgi:hypothetical protein